VAIPIPENDQERLEALQSYDILDTAPEEALDHFTDLAAAYLDTPIALISLVDESRQWFKSRHGLDATETARELAFCSHAIMDDQVFIVGDATKDERFASNPLVTGDPNVRFYAGAPLINKDGFRLGTLCAIDDKPREISKNEERILKMLAELVIEQFEIRRTNVLLKEQQKELEIAKRSAEDANRAKTEFLSAMSHELRTPMNAILGFGQLLGHMPGETLSEKQLDYTEQILNSGQHLLELIDQVLELSKIEAGQISLSLENVDPFAVMEECITMVNSKAEDDDIQIFLNCDAADLTQIWTDRGRFRQVLINLLSNAIKYNRVGGSITLTSEKIGNHSLKFNVSDTGYGIPASQQPFMFEPFNRLGKENSTVEGTGIGLTISKQIIEFLGGEISFSSQEDVGSTFSLELPINEDKLMAANKQIADNSSNFHEDETSGAMTTILYVEDNPSNLHLMEELIKRLPNYAMISAPSAELALHIARDEQPNVVLMDINLPGMDGVEALKHLRAQKETKDIPVIALTAAAMPREIERGKEAGFQEYITKPINITEVLNAINTHTP
jgi:two-component system, sensor histidine kinase